MFGRLLKEYLHAPLYIPPEGRFVLKELEVWTGIEKRVIPGIHAV
jgi:hypothetical protein